MRLFRFGALVVALIAVYLAQYIFDFRSLNTLFPTWFLDTFPSLYAVTRWLPEDLMSLATTFTLLGAVLFGLISTPWAGEYPKPVQRAKQHTPHSPALLFGIGTMALAFCFTLYLAGRTYAGSSGNRLTDFGWLLGAAFYLLGSALIDNGLSQRRTLLVLQAAPGAHPSVRPESGWPQLLLILLAALLLFGWGLTQMPLRVEPLEAESGLQALAIARNETHGLFTPIRTALPQIAHWPAAVGMRLTGEVLLGARLVSVLQGMLLTAATWLLSCELFRRVPRQGPYGVVLEDDGRWIALLAALTVAVGHVAIHFSRIPIYLAPAAWGVLGLWMLLRGLRTNSYSLLALSGLSIGLAGVTYASGMLLWIVTPLWWLGLWLLRRGWIDPRYAGIGVGGGAVWLGASALIALPVCAYWISRPESYAQFMQSSLAVAPEVQNRLTLLYQQGGLNSLFGENLRLLLLTLNAYPDAGSMMAYPATFLHSLLAPLFFLALGSLLLNLDRLPGWLLLSYLGSTLVYGVANAIPSSWSLLLPLYPVAAIFIAFALDRIRLTLLETAGSWLEQTSIYLTIGLLLWVGVKSWTSYYEYAYLQADDAAVIGRAIVANGAPENSVLLIGDEDPVHWANPVVEYVASRLNQRPVGAEYSVDNLPDALPAGTQLLIQPPNAPLLPLIQERYPTGVLEIERDLRGNILLYIYRL